MVKKRKKKKGSKKKKKNWFARLFSSPEKEVYKGTKEVQDAILDTTKGVEKVSDKLFGTATKEFSDVGNDFNHVTDRFLKGLMKEKWPTKGIYVKDVMEKATKIKDTDSIKKVVNKLKTTEDTLIVISGKNKIVGTIAEANLLKLMIPEEKLDTQEVIGFMGAGYDTAFLAKKAKDLMRKKIYFVTPSMPIEKVAFLMYKEDLRSIPVVKGKKIVGVVHIRNVIRSLK